MLRSSPNRIVLRVEGIVVVLSLIAVMKKVPVRGEPCGSVKHNVVFVIRVSIYNRIYLLFMKNKIKGSITEMSPADSGSWRLTKWPISWINSYR